MLPNESNFDLLPVELLYEILTKLHLREQVAPNLAFRKFYDAYTTLRGDEQLASVMTNSVLAKQFLETSEPNLNAIVITYLQSLGIDLNGHTDFKAYLLSIAPDFWLRIELEPSDFIQRLEHWFQKASEVKSLYGKADEKREKQVLNYFSELSKVEQQLKMLGMYLAIIFNTEYRVSFIAQPTNLLLRRLKLTDLMDSTEALNLPYLQEIIAAYVYYLKAMQEASLDVQQLEFCQLIKELFAKASQIEIERLARQALSLDTIVNLLTIPEFGIVKKLDPQILTDLVMSLRNDRYSRRIVTLFGEESSFFAEAPMHIIFYALSELNMFSTQDTWVSGAEIIQILQSLMRKRFLQRCRTTDEKAQWYIQFDKLLTEGDLSVAQFIDCLEAIEPPRASQAIADYLAHAKWAHKTKPENLVYIYQLINSPKAVKKLTEQQMQALVEQLADAEFKKFIESAVLQKWLSANRPVSKRLLVIKWLERYQQLTGNNAIASPRIERLQKVAYPAAIQALDWLQGKSYNPQQEFSSPLGVNYLERLSKIPLTLKEEERLSTCFSQAEEVFSRETTKLPGHYKPVADLLVTNKSMHKFCSEKSLHSYAKAYPELAQKILAYTADKLSTYQKRKTPSLLRRIISNAPVTLLKGVANLAVLPLYILGGFAATILGLVGLPIVIATDFILTDNYDLTKIAGLLSLGAVWAPALQLLYTATMLRNFWTGEVNYALADKKFSLVQKMGLLFGGALSDANFPQKYEILHPTIADMAANYELTLPQTKPTIQTKRPSQGQAEESGIATQNGHYTRPTSASDYLLGKTQTRRNYTPGTATEPSLPLSPD